MNEIINKFLPVGDKFIPEMHLKQRGFTYSAYGLLTKNKERIKIQILFIKMNLINLVFNMIGLMENQKIE